jgi:hypothetical protein
VNDIIDFIPRTLTPEEDTVLRAVHDSDGNATGSHLRQVLCWQGIDTPTVDRCCLSLTLTGYLIVQPVQVPDDDIRHVLTFQGRWYVEHMPQPRVTSLSINFNALMMASVLIAIFGLLVRDDAPFIVAAAGLSAVVCVAIGRWLMSRRRRFRRF